jgi:hypothetical protein
LTTTICDWALAQLKWFDGFKPKKICSGQLQLGYEENLALMFWADTWIKFSIKEREKNFFFPKPVKIFVIKGLPGLTLLWFLPVLTLFWGKPTFCAQNQGCQKVYFKPKIQIWINFGGFRHGRCGYILWPFGTLCCPLVYFKALLVYFSLFWYVDLRKIWQTCTERVRH